MNMFSLLKTKECEARVVSQGDGEALVLAFQNSVQPILWRASLGTNPDLSFQVVEQDGVWALGVTVAGKPFAAIAQFVTRDEADAAFAVARGALLNGVRTPLKPRWILLIALVALVGLYEMVGTGSSKKETSAISAVGEVVSNAEDKISKKPKEGLFRRPLGEKPKVEDGVPLSADDVLKPPPEE